MKPASNLLHDLPGEVVTLVVFGRVRGHLVLGKISGHLGQGDLFFGQRIIDHHNSLRAFVPLLQETKK
jgi:hypothetical protein